MQNRFNAYAVEICVVAVLWIALFKLNMWLFSAIEVNAFITWIFLPAAVRILSVLVADWCAVVGLFIGTVITCNPIIGVNVLDSVTLGLISSLSPMIAVRTTTKLTAMKTDLKDMTFAQLIVMSAVGGLVSCLFHNIYFHLRDSGHQWVTGLVSMLTGDLVGSLIVLYVAGFALRRLSLNSDQ